MAGGAQRYKPAIVKILRVCCSSHDALALGRDFRFSFNWPGNPAIGVVLVTESTVFDNVEDDAWNLPNCAAFGMNISRVCC